MVRLITSVTTVRDSDIFEIWENKYTPQDFEVLRIHVVQSN